MLESQLTILVQVQEPESLKCDSGLFGGSAAHLNESSEEVCEDLSDLTVWHFRHYTDSREAQLEQFSLSE